MLPGHLIAEFWEEVAELLRKQHDLSEERARQGIAEYRYRLDLHRVGDMVYHENAAHVARTIAGALRQGGFREPEVQEMRK
jgi:hypothetical protein